MELVIRALNAKVLSSKFSRFAEATTKMRPALNLAADIMMEAIRENFETEGEHGGETWPELTEEWLARKIKAGDDPRIGFMRHFLVDSFTVRRAPHQILKVTNSTLTLSSSLPYAGTQQKHRPFIRLTPVDKAAMRNVMRDYIRDAFRA